MLLVEDKRKECKERQLPPHEGMMPPYQTTPERACQQPTFFEERGLYHYNIGIGWTSANQSLDLHMLLNSTKIVVQKKNSIVQECQWVEKKLVAIQRKKIQLCHEKIDVLLQMRLTTKLRCQGQGVLRPQQKSTYENEVALELMGNKGSLAASKIGPPNCQHHKPPSQKRKSYTWE